LVEDAKILTEKSELGTIRESLPVQIWREKVCLRKSRRHDAQTVNSH
jgi:hypothetical protein